MKKFVALGLSLFLLSTPSLAKRTPVQKALDGQKHTLQKIQTATKNVLVHAASRTQRKLLAINEIIDDESDNPAGPDELDLQSPYGRARLVESRDQDHDDIGDHARVRLAVARAKALKKYQQHWGQDIYT